MLYLLIDWRSAQFELFDFYEIDKRIQFTLLEKEASPLLDRQLPQRQLLADPLPDRLQAIRARNSGECPQNQPEADEARKRGQLRFPRRLPGPRRAGRGGLRSAGPKARCRNYPQPHAHNCRPGGLAGGDPTDYPLLLHQAAGIRLRDFLALPREAPGRGAEVPDNH